MAFLFQSTPKTIPEFTGLQVNTAVQVLPIPIIYGSPRVSINLVYYNGFNVQQVQQGGKGFLTGGKGGQTTEYFATLIMSIGEGIIDGILVIYQDQAVYTPADYPSNGAFFFSGGPSQTPWSYIVSNWPNDARGYKDTSYYGFSNAQLDSTATVPQINLVPQGVFHGTSPLNKSTITISTGQYDSNGNPITFIGDIDLGYADADPAECIYDLLTNVTYGAGFPASMLDVTNLFTSPQGFDLTIGDSALSTYCQAVGLGYSVVLNNAETANSIIDRWTTNLVVAPVWNGAVLRFIPYWDTPCQINPGWGADAGVAQKYFVPNVTPITFITPDQVLQSENQSDDPITFSRKDPMLVYNTIRVDFRDRNNFFNDNVVEAKDEAHAELNGPRVDNIGLANEFSLAVYANVSAQAKLRRNVSIMNEFTLKLGPLWAWIDPMDAFLIPDPTNLLASKLIRIISAEDDENDNVMLTCEELPLGSQSPTLIPTSNTTAPNQGPTNTPCAAVSQPVIFEPTTLMLTATGIAASTPQIAIGTTGSISGVLDPYWGGYNVWVSLDDASYEQVTPSQVAPSTIGYTTNNFDSSTGATIGVNLAECDGVLGSPGPLAALAGKSICILMDSSGFEIVAYSVATLTGVSKYNLGSGLVRGMYGTTARSWNAGSQFLYVGTDSNFFEAPLPPQYQGVPLYIKLQSFNTYRNYVQALSSCVVYQYTPHGSTPVAPAAPSSMIRADYKRPRIAVTTQSLRRRNRPGV